MWDFVRLALLNGRQISRLMRSEVTPQHILSCIVGISLEKRNHSIVPRIRGLLTTGQLDGRNAVGGVRAEGGVERGLY